MFSLRILTECLAVTLFGALCMTAFSQEGGGVEKSELRVAALKTYEDYMYAVFLPKSAIKQETDGTPKLTVKIFEGNDTKTKPVSSKGLINPYFEIDNKIIEPYEDYTLEITEGEKIILERHFKSSAGRPSKIDHADWNMNKEPKDTSKAILHWKRPSDPKGPIDGYKVVHCHSDIISLDQRKATTEETKLQCYDPVYVSDNQCEIELQRNKRYETRIQAFNNIPPDYDDSQSEAGRIFSEEFKVNPTNDNPVSSDNRAALVVSIVIAVLLSLVIVGYAGYKYYRKNYN